MAFTRAPRLTPRPVPSPVGSSFTRGGARRDDTTRPARHRRRQTPRGRRGCRRCSPRPPTERRALIPTSCLEPPCPSLAFIYRKLTTCRRRFQDEGTQYRRRARYERISAHAAGCFARADVLRHLFHGAATILGGALPLVINSHGRSGLAREEGAASVHGYTGALRANSKGRSGQVMEEDAAI